MSGITGSEARKLKEAYGAVYQRQQFKENFEKWVSELVEEGYDFSAYTWNEVADVFVECITSNEGLENLNEQVSAALPYVLPALRAGAAALGAYGLLKGRGSTPATGPSTWDYGQSGTSTYTKPKPVVKPAARPAARPSAPEVVATNKLAATTKPVVNEPGASALGGALTLSPAQRASVFRTQGEAPTGEKPSSAELEKKMQDAKEKAKEPEFKSTEELIKQRKAEQAKTEQPPTPSSTPSQHGARIGRTYPKPEEPKPPKQETPKVELPKQETPKPKQETPKPGGPGPLEKIYKTAADIGQKFEKGRQPARGMSTAERVGDIVGAGQKTAAGTMHWTTKNLLAKPLGVGLGAAGAGAIGYGAYKGGEAALKAWGPKKNGGSGSTNVPPASARGETKEDVNFSNIIKKYLIDENYASDEKAALKIMENMGEEWKKSVIDAYFSEEL